MDFNEQELPDSVGGDMASDKTEYGDIMVSGWRNQEQAGLALCKALAELIEIPEAQEVFRKYNISVVYIKPYGALEEVELPQLPAPGS